MIENLFNKIGQDVDEIFSMNLKVYEEEDEEGNK